MTGLERPLALALVVPWSLLVLWIGLRQRQALRWLEARTHPARRWRLTGLSHARLVLHLAAFWLAGAALAVAAAGPYATAPGEREVRSRSIALVVDASLSMLIPDAVRPEDPDAEPETRLAQAGRFALDLVDRLPRDTFALVSFSGDAVVHAPPSRDHHAVRLLLETLGPHNYEQLSGSRFSRAFDAVIHLMRTHRAAWQVVLLSDGELSRKDDFRDALEIFAARGVPVHTVAIGGDSWFHAVVPPFAKLGRPVEKVGKVASFTSRRNPGRLARMSRATGGEALVIRPGVWVEDLIPALTGRGREETVRVAGMRRRGLGHWPAALALLLLAVEGLAGARRGGRPPARPHDPWHRERLALFLAVLLAVAGGTACRAPLVRAHRVNEEGLRAQRVGGHRRAERLFERAAAFGVREAVPTYNLARSLWEEEDLAGAHQAYQRALTLDPGLHPAAYNDGIVLYRMGMEALEPGSCRYARVRTLWEAARDRFAGVERHTVALGRLHRWAASNRRAVETALEELARLEAACEGAGGPGSGGAGEQGGAGEGEKGRAEGQGGAGEQGSRGGGGAGGGSGGGAGRGGGGEGGAAAGLSAAEKERLAGELERVREQSESSTSYRQSGATRPHPANEGKGGTTSKIWW